MRNIKLLFMALGLLAMQALPAAAQELQKLDTSLELQASKVTLPTTMPGTVTVQTCTGCLTYRFSLSAASGLMVDTSVVNLATLRSVFAARPEALILLTMTRDRRSIELIAITSDPAGQ